MSGMPSPMNTGTTLMTKSSIACSSRKEAMSSPPPDGPRDQLEPPDPLRPRRAIGTRRMTRVQQDAFRGGERDTQHHRRPPPIGLPDIAGDRLRLRRAILSTEQMCCGVEVTRQPALWFLRADVSGADVADGVGGGVRQVCRRQQAAA